MIDFRGFISRDPLAEAAQDILCTEEISYRMSLAEGAEKKNVTLVLLAGVPGSGKTTIFCKVIEKLKADKPFDYKLVRGTTNEKGDYVLGIYDGSTFQGTDRLSMAVQPDLIKFVQHLEREGKPVTIFAEGDRVTNHSFIEKFKDQINLLVVETEHIDKYRKARGKTQPANFKKAKRTEVDRLINRFNAQIVRNQDGHSNPDKIAKLICDYAKS
jgi:hypothetical protein